MLNEQALEDYIDARYQQRGDRLFRMERRPWYDTPSQNADRAAFAAGHLDTSRIAAWADILASDVRRGLISERVRMLSQELTLDELMSVNVALPITSAWEDVYVLHHGEHPVLDLLDHDYWIIQPATGGTDVLRMHYSDGGVFEGAEVVPPAQHAPYLREKSLALAIGEPFPKWWIRHGELHRTAA